MTKLINKLLYFANGIAEQVSLVDPEALLKVTAIQTKSIEATDGTQVAKLDKAGLSLTDAAGADLQTLNQAVLKALIVLQGIDSSRAATYAQLQTEINARTLRDGQLTTGINDEVGRASQAEADLRGLIGQESLDRAAADQAIRSDFAQVDTNIRADFAAADLLLSGAIEQETTDRGTQYGIIHQAVLDIAAQAIAAEGVIQGNINTISGRMTTDETALGTANQALTNEIAARGLQYTEIHDAIGAETTRATGVEAGLQNAIDTLPSKLEWQDSVNSAVAYASLPASPAEGARYLVVSGLHVNAIAQWHTSAYVFTTPTVGMFVTVDDQNDSIKYYNGSAWVAKVWENYAAGAGLNLTSNTMKVADLGVIEAMLADGAVTGSKIADSAVDNVTIEKAMGVGAPVLMISNTVIELDLPVFEQFYQGSVVRGYASQSFTVASPASISEIQFSLLRDVTAFTDGSIRVSLYEGGVDDTPTGSVLGYAEILATSLTRTRTWRSFAFNSPIAVTARKYCAVISKVNVSNPSSPNSVVLKAGLSYTINQISGGRQGESPNGTAWTFQNGTTADCAIKVYAAGASPLQLAVKNSGVTAAKLAAGAITDVKVSATAAIQMSKIAGLTAAIANAQSSSTTIVVPSSQGLASPGDIMFQGASNASQAVAGSITTCRALLGAQKVQISNSDSILIVGKIVVNPEAGVTLAVGDIVYLSSVFLGKVTNVAPTALNSCVVEVGVMVSSTEMLIKPSFKYKIV